MGTFESCMGSSVIFQGVFICKLYSTPCDLAYESLMYKEQVFLETRTTQKARVAEVDEKNAKDICMLLNSMQNKNGEDFDKALMTSSIDRQILRLKRQCLVEQQPPKDYVLPLGKKDMDAPDYPAFPLLPAVTEFLHGEKRVLLIIGDGGSGKSYFLRQLERELWGKYTSPDDAVPILVSLPFVDNATSDLLGQVLQTNGFRNADVRTLKQSTRRFILLCDGYDEAQVLGNIYNSNRFHQPGQGRVKLIIACRSQKLGADSDGRFEPVTGDHYNSTNLNQFQKVAMAPFTRSMIMEYVEKFVATRSQPEVRPEYQTLPENSLAWSLEQYMYALSNIPHLMDLVGNPYILSFILEELPKIAGSARDETGPIVSFDVLYKRVFAKWMTPNMQRLRSRVKTNEEERAFIELFDYNFAGECMKHMKDLAVQIVRNQKKHSSSVRYTFNDPAEWKSKFFGRDPTARLLQELIPLTRSGTTYRFLFPSLLDYLFSLAVFNPDGSVLEDINTDGSMAYDSDSYYSEEDGEPLFSKSSSGQHFEGGLSPQKGQALMEGKEKEIGKALDKDHVLGSANISNRSMAIQFLADRVLENQCFKEQLIETIKDSPNSGESDQSLAANAITILVRSGMRFNSADLRDIKIKGANLTSGEFDSSNSDLRDVTFDKCWLRQAKLERAQLTGSKFGESPYIPLDDVPTASAYSPNGKFYAATFDRRYLTVYDATKWENATSKQFPDAITSVAFSPDNNLLAFGDDIGVLRIWEYTSTSIISHLPSVHGACISSLVFSPDGNRIATAGYDGKIGLWDVASGSRCQVLEAHSEGPSYVSFSPDGKRLLSGGFDKVVRLWDLTTGGQVLAIKTHNDAVTQVLFSNDGLHIASSSSDTTVRVRTLSTGAKETIFRGHSKAVTGLICSPDGRQLVSCGEDSTIRVWDIHSGGSGPVLRGHTDTVVGIAFSQKGRQLTSCGRDKTLRIWDYRAAFKGAVLFGLTNSMSSGIYPYSTIKQDDSDDTAAIRPTSPSPRWGRFFSSESSGSKVASITTSRDGSLVASTSTIGDKQAIVIWFRDTNEIFRTLITHLKDISCIAFSPDSLHIASGSADNTIHIWSIDSGKFVKTLKGHRKKVTSIAYSSRGHQIVSGSKDDFVILWDTLSGEKVHAFETDSAIQSVTFSPSDSWIVSGGEDGAVTLWDSNNVVLPVIWDDGHAGTVNCVAFSPDSTRVASGGDDRKVRIWNVVTKSLERELQVEGQEAVSCLTYSPSGQHVAIVSLSYTSDGGQLWIGSGYKVHVWTNDVFAVHQAVVASGIELSRDCRQVAWSLGENKVQLFSADTGEAGKVLSGHSNVIECVSYSPVHNIVATASRDGTVRLWNSQTGESLVKLKGYDDIVTGVIFSPKGTQIAVSCETMLCLWNLESESPLKAGNQGDVLQADTSGFTIDNQGVSPQEVSILGAVSVNHAVEMSSAPVYSPDGKEIAVGSSDDHKVQRFNTQGGEKSPPPLNGHIGTVTCIAYTLLGDKIATGSEDNTARIWDRYTGNQLFQLSEHSGGVTSIAFSPFDDQVATGDNGSTVRLWSSTHAGPGHALNGHHGSILCLAYSPDGKILASGSADRTMQLWNLSDISDRLDLATVGDFAAGVESIRWMNMGGRYRLVTGSDENPLGVWELVRHGNSCYVRRCWSAGVHALAVSDARVGPNHGLKAEDVTLLKQRKAVEVAQQ
ncbi:hypothetical protein BGZ97_000407 [Linnemannia gamsii]|uniref:WD40 repeat-like protein n=1 Tax=Linnemannia gamsii TaxID=64522 RepID=A0A9P6QYC1_9FUNG|nr:hypothetical protein BGZ97_000407 [Linnemannia gamsii]